MRTVGIACIALAAAASAASAALPTTRYYQRTIFKSCGTGLACQAVFPAVSSTRILQVNHISCRVFVSPSSAVVSHLSLTSDKSDGTFFLELTPIATSNGRNFGARLVGPVHISPSGRPQITLLLSGQTSASFECGIAGLLIDPPASSATTASPEQGAL
jgi:hypothetical protein